MSDNINLTGLKKFCIWGIIWYICAYINFSGGKEKIS